LICFKPEVISEMKLVIAAHVDIPNILGKL
jgi:hypothetical protein